MASNGLTANMRTNALYIVTEIKRNWGAPTANMISKSGKIRLSCRELLIVFGWSPKDTDKVSSSHLAVVCAATQNSIETGYQVAERLRPLYTCENPLLDDVIVTPPERPMPPITTKPVDMPKYVEREEWRSVRTQDTDRLRISIRDLRSDFTETMLKVTEALPESITSEVNAAVEKAFKAIAPVTLIVEPPAAPPVNLGLVHRMTPKLIKMLAAGVNVYLHGPAGSGKTTAAHLCAKTFNAPFYFAAKVESEYMLLGFKDARGETVRTQFRDAYEHGGVFLFDELDGSSPSAVVALNAALANGFCPFPDGIIARHKDFKCIAAGNTKLTGATREYVGRNQLDAASVDRFSFIEWLYDDALETSIATNAEWCKYVQSARRAVAARSLKHLVTPRATYDGCKLIQAGLTREEVEEAVLWKGLDTETVSQLKKTMDYKEPSVDTKDVPITVKQGII